MEHEYQEIYKCLKEGTEIDYDTHENWEHHPHLTEEEMALAEEENEANKYHSKFPNFESNDV